MTCIFNHTCEYRLCKFTQVNIYISYYYVTNVTIYIVQNVQISEVLSDGLAADVLPVDPDPDQGVPGEFLSLSKSNWDGHVICLFHSF